MKKILFILVLIFSLSMVVEAKPRYSRHKYTTYAKYQKSKSKKYKYKKTKSKVCHFNPNAKFKKCSLSKVYKVK